MRHAPLIETSCGLLATTHAQNYFSNRKIFARIGVIYDGLIIIQKEINIAKI